MLAKITTDGYCNRLFDTIEDARKWCIDYFRQHPTDRIALEICVGGVVKGWVIYENSKPVWKKNVGSRYSEYYILTREGKLRNTALNVLNGKQLYDACSIHPPMLESDARRIVRKPTQYGIKNERNVGWVFQVVDTRSWAIVRHGWTFVGVNRHTDRTREVIIYVPSRRIVQWADKES